MWFGHGTASGKLKGQGSGSASAQGKGDPILALAFGAVAALASAQRGRAEAQFQGSNLSRFRDSMTAWMRGVRMDSATFAGRFFGRDGDDPVAQILHRAALDAGLAKTPAEFAQAARGVADAMKAVGLDRWARFIADAQSRARDPATVAAIEKSLRPPDLPVMRFGLSTRLKLLSGLGRPVSQEVPERRCAPLAARSCGKCFPTAGLRAPAPPGEALARLKARPARLLPRPHRLPLAGLFVFTRGSKKSTLKDPTTSYRGAAR
jgi:hypothetical protein